MPTLKKYRRQRKAPIPLGGWLLLPAIFLGFNCIRAVFYLGSILANLGSIHGLASWISLVIMAASWSFTLYVSYAFFQRKSSAPLFVSALVLLSLAITFLYLMLLLLSAEVNPGKHPVTEFFISLMDAFIWIPYFRFSKRVKATFVR